MFERLTLPLLAALLLWPATAQAQSVPAPVTSQLIYVPAYVSVLTQADRSEPLAATLVVHNVDPEQNISVTQIDFHDNLGVKLSSHLPAPVILRPFASTSALIPLRSDGGVGANFLVSWNSSDPALPPVVEAIMVGGNGTQGISVKTSGQVIRETP